MEDEKKVIPVGQSMGGFIMPPVAPAELKKMWKTVQQAKASVLDKKSDYVDIRGKRIIVKSGVTKLAYAFGIRFTILDRRRVPETPQDGQTFTHYVLGRAEHLSSGRWVDDVGACTSNERQFNHVEADVFQTAQTRCYNRAVLKLVGLGDVTAEELTDQLHHDIARPTKDEVGPASVKHEVPRQINTTLAKGSLPKRYPGGALEEDVHRIRDIADSWDMSLLDKQALITSIVGRVVNANTITASEAKKVLDAMETVERGEAELLFSETGSPYIAPKGGNDESTAI